MRSVGQRNTEPVEIGMLLCLVVTGIGLKMNEIHHFTKKGLVIGQFLPYHQAMFIKSHRVVGGAVAAMTILATAASSYGALILNTTIESATTGLNPQMSPENAINGSGLPGDAPALTGSHGNSFNTNWWTGWDGNVTEWQLTVDLEGSYDVDTVQIWNYREGCCSGRGLSNVEIYVASDENETNLIKLTTNGTGLHDDGSGNFLLPEAPSAGDYFGFNLDMSGVTNPALLDNVRLFRIDGGTSLHGGGEIHAGLAEIQFGGVNAIPEPSTTALAFLALGSLAARRRRV